MLGSPALAIGGGERRLADAPTPMSAVFATRPAPRFGTASIGSIAPSRDRKCSGARIGMLETAKTSHREML
jgi:hypothetical protein